MSGKIRNANGIHIRLLRKGMQNDRDVLDE